MAVTTSPRTTLAEYYGCQFIRVINGGQWRNATDLQ
jgi:hypothetical protein